MSSFTPIIIYTKQRKKIYIYIRLCLCCQIFSSVTPKQCPSLGQQWEACLKQQTSLLRFRADFVGLLSVIKAVLEVHSLKSAIVKGPLLKNCHWSTIFCQLAIYQASYCGCQGYRYLVWQGISQPCCCYTVSNLHHPKSCAAVCAGNCGKSCPSAYTGAHFHWAISQGW